MQTPEERSHRALRRIESTSDRRSSQQNGKLLLLIEGIVGHVCERSALSPYIRSCQMSVPFHLSVSIARQHPRTCLLPTRWGKRLELPLPQMLSSSPQRTAGAGVGLAQLNKGTRKGRWYTSERSNKRRCLSFALGHAHRHTPHTHTLSSCGLP